jgi:phospholipid-translocating ATPase
MCTDLLLCSDVELLNAVANNSHVIKFLTVMTLCNTVIPIKSSSGAILYKAQSQDEDALVNAASNLHMVLVNKNGNTAGRFITFYLSRFFIYFPFLVHVVLTK